MTSDPVEQRRLAAIMFTDLVGYSALSHRNEALALELLGISQALLRAQFGLFDGREVKSTGDGFLAEFSSALRATECAVAIQREVAAHNSTQPDDRHLRVRIGLHVGDVVYRERDVYGDGVNIAARIEPLAVGGGICLSDTIYAQVQNKLNLKLIKLDSPKLKHIETPMDVYRVILPGETVPAEKAPDPVVPAHHRVGPLFWVLAAVVLMIAAGVAWRLAHPAETRRPRHGQGPAVETKAKIDEKSVAVLPFRNLSRDPNDEYLSDGMTEELLNALAKVNELRVPGRDSSFVFKGQSGKDVLRQVGDQLHVATALEGSVRKVGNALRVTASLVKVSDGLLLWSDQFDGDLTNLFAFQTFVAQHVVDRLAVKMGVEEAQSLQQAPTVSPSAYRLYWLGQSHLHKANFAGFTNAISFFEQATGLDTNYALAYCGLADAYAFIGGIQVSGKEGWAKEKAYAERALAIDPNLAEAHFSLGLALANSFQWAEGEKEIKRAIDMNTNMAVAYDQYAYLLTCLGRHEEAIAMSRRAVDLDPYSPLMNTDLAWWLMFAKQYDEAATQSQRAMELDPHLSLAHWARGWSLLWNGNQPGAVAEFERAKSLEAEPFFEAALGYAYGVSGQPAKAAQVRQDLENTAQTRYVSPGLVVYPELGLGEKQNQTDIFDRLNRALEAQDYPCPFLKVDRAFDGLRNDLRFQALLKKAGLGQ